MTEPHTALLWALAAGAGLALCALAVAGCGGDSGDGAPDAAASADAAPGADAPTGADAGAAGACPTGGAGLACLFAQWDALAPACDPAALAAFDASLAARHGDLPAWYQGRALFVTRGAAASVAGDWNGWGDGALVTAPVCGSTTLYAVEAAVPSGRHAYKLVSSGTWSLDAENWAFAYDDFAGNADGRNSVLNTYDSGLGHLVQPDQKVCSTALGNCRPFTTYLPRGYGAPENADRHYPVVFMHDGQNIFDDHTCCFGHTGWEVNVTLDGEIAAGKAEETVIVGFDHAGVNREQEYGIANADGGERDTFMDFQVHTVQPRAAELWRLDPARTYVAGSSLGGLVSFELAFAYPGVYAGAAGLSPSFWEGQDTGDAMRDVIPMKGLQPVALYLDHGGDPQSGSDGYADAVEVRDLLVQLGWTRGDSPSCTAGAHALCYFWDAGATHDELAWQARSWRWIEFFVGK